MGPFTNAGYARNPKKSPPQADPPMAETTDYTDFTDKEQILKTSKDLLGLPISVSIRVHPWLKSFLIQCFLVFYSGS